MEEKQIKFRRGDIISSEKYGWRKIITKVLTITDELKLMDEGDDEFLDDGYTFSIENTQSRINAGVYKYEKRKEILPVRK